MIENIKDPRTSLEQAGDLTDQQLFDFYHRNGLIEAREGTTYSREAVMNIARNAYWLGAADRAKDPEGTARVAAEVRRVMKAA